MTPANDFEGWVGSDGANRFLSSLEAEAESRSEAFLGIAQGDGYKLGVTVEMNNAGFKHTIELMLRLFRSGETIDLGSLAERSSLLSMAQDRGYSVLSLDNGWVCCTLPLPRSEVSRELMYVFVTVPKSNP